MYAIFESGGKQHRAEPGGRLAVENLPGAPGATVTFDRVLLVRDPDSGECRIGSPYVDGARVSAAVIAQYRAPKIIVFKRKRRKGYRRKQGHRQGQTGILIKEIIAGPGEPDETPAQA